MNRTLGLTLVSAAMLCFGCTGETSSKEEDASSDGNSTDGDRDTEPGETDDTDSVTCQETVTVIDLSTPSSGGVIPSEVVDEVEGTYTGVLRWTAEGPVSYTGSVEPTSVEVEIAYEGGEARDIDAELVNPCPHDGPCPCPDRLEIDVTMRIVSGDGTLDEVWTVPLEHISADEADSYWTLPGTSVYFGFDPDQTQGTLSLASFSIDEGVTLEQMLATLSLSSGALSGTLMIEVSSDMGWFGAGNAASLAAVTEVSPSACRVFSSGSDCEDVGCTNVSGRPLWNTSNCECGDARSYCLAEPLQGEAVPTAYTHPVDDGFESWNEVVLFDALDPSPEAPWRLCSEAPEVEGCSTCFTEGDGCTN